MRVLSGPARAAIFAQSTDEVFLVLLTIAHPNIADGPLRFVNNMSNIFSRGNEYLAFPFDIILPDENENRPPRAKLTIDNIDRRIVRAVREVQGQVTVTLEIVLASSPDIVEYGPSELTLTDVLYDALTVEGNLGPEDVLSEPIPGDSFDPSRFPGLF